MPIRRETRANLLFLALFLAVSLPGAVILFRKKLEPDSHSFASPDPVRQSISYTAPVSTPDSIKRVVPAGLAEWIDGVTNQYAGTPPLPARDPRGYGLPAIADDRSFEVLGVVPNGQDAGGERLVLLLWNSSTLDPAKDLTAALSDPATNRPVHDPVKLTRLSPVPVPHVLRQRLIDLGHVEPPAAVSWAEAVLPAAVPRNAPLRCALSTGGAHAASADLIVGSPRPYR